MDDYKFVETCFYMISLHTATQFLDQKDLFHVNQ